MIAFTLNALELPKDALLEKYLLSAKKYESQGKYKKAISSFEKIEKLNITLPKEFYYRYAINLYKDKQYRKSEIYFKDYILQSTRDDEHYKSSLEYLTSLEDEEEEQEIQEARCDELPNIIDETQERCINTCEDITNRKIDNNLYQYPNHKSYELYNIWYPQCMKTCEKNYVRSLTKEYKRRCK